MKAEKKPKRPNPYRSNEGFANLYPEGTHKQYRRARFAVPVKPIGRVLITRSGHQHARRRRLEAAREEMQKAA